jgi:hypothetical protein
MTARPWDFHPEALAELDAAGRWYEERRGGIGEEFVDRVHEALADAGTFPSPGVTVPSVRLANVRRLLMTPRFPYAVILLTDARVVIAVAHLHRRPNYWRVRLPRRNRAATRTR